MRESGAAGARWARAGAALKRWTALSPSSPGLLLCGGFRSAAPLAGGGLGRGLSGGAVRADADHADGGKNRGQGGGDAADEEGGAVAAAQRVEGEVVRCRSRNAGRQAVHGDRSPLRGDPARGPQVVRRQVRAVQVRRERRSRLAQGDRADDDQAEREAEIAEKCWSWRSPCPPAAGARCPVPRPSPSSRTARSRCRSADRAGLRRSVRGR